MIKSTLILDQTRLLLVSVLLFLAHTVTAEESCIDGEVRLLVTEQTHLTVTGFVQYCMSEEWRMVCRGSATSCVESVLARTTCRQLGYEDNGFIMSDQNSSYSSQLLVNIDCTDGRKAGLQDCEVTITTDSLWYLFPTFAACPTVATFAEVTCYKICSSGEIRLVGGSTNREGRVEVCVDGHWESVCNHSQKGITEAVCSQLGFPMEDASITNSTSKSASRVFLCYPNHTCTTVHCNSSQSLAVKCLSHQELEVVERHSFCPGNQKGDFRLMNGSSPNEGRVEVCVDGGWTHVCDCGTNHTELANKICYSLGFSNKGFVSMEYNWGKLGACCFTNETHHKVTCVKSCNCNKTLEVVCQMHQTSTEELLERCPTVEPSPTMSIVDHREVVTKTLSNCSLTAIEVAVNASEEMLSNSSQCSQIITPLGAVSGVLLALLACALVGWMVTCAVWRRGAMKCSLDTPTPQDENYIVHMLESHSNNTTPTLLIDMNTNSVQELDTIASLCHQNSNSTTQTGLTNPAPMTVESNIGLDDFYNAEEHTYSVVDKKRAKKTSEDGEGEREESSVYNSIMVMASQEEVYSKLKH